MAGMPPHFDEDPIVFPPLGARLCRPLEAVLDIPCRSRRAAPSASKEDGEAVVDEEGYGV